MLESQRIFLMTKPKILLWDLSDWSCKSPGYRPFARKDSFVKILCCNTDGQFSGPFANRLRSTIVGNNGVVITVIRLFASSSPPTVLGRIVAVNIEAVKSCRRILELMLKVRFTHIFQEVLEVIPTFANPKDRKS